MSVRKETVVNGTVTTTGYRVDFTVTLPNGRKIRERKFGSWTRRQAEQWERERREEILNPSPVAAEAKPTVAAYFAAWIAGPDCAQNNTSGTIQEKEGDGKRWILPLLGHLTLDAIDVAILREFQRKMARKPGEARAKGNGLGPKSVKNVVATLMRMLNYAAEEGVIAVAPKLPRQRGKQAREQRQQTIEFFDRYEVATLLQAVTDPMELASMLVGFDLGLRTGEHLALEWGQVNFRASKEHPFGCVVVSQAISRGKLGTPKSGQRRTVPMTERLHGALKAIRGLRHLQGGRVFPELTDPWALGRQLARACARAGLRRLHRHGARHSFATNHLAMGTPLAHVSAWLGHADVSITAKVYAHASPLDAAAFVGRLEAPLPGAEPTANVTANVP